MPNDPTASIHTVDPGPSRLWYLLAIAIFVAGMAGMGAFLSSQLSGLGDDLEQMVVPGEREFELEAGSYTIFHERVSIVNGRIYNADGTGLGVTLTSTSGAPVTLTLTSTSSSYEFAGRRGAAVLQFEIRTPGAYLLSAAYREGAAGPETVLAIGSGFAGNLLLTLLGAFAISLIGIGLGLFVGWGVFYRRREAGRANEGRIG